MQQYFSNKREDNVLYFDKEDFNHIKNVMRFKNGEEVLVVYNKTCFLCTFNSSLESASIVSEYKTMNENEIVAYIPVLQEEKMSFVIEKGTELGVTKFIPVNFQNCKYKICKDKIDKKILRWNKIAKEASEQARRTIIPSVSYPVSISEIELSSNVNLLCSLDKKNVKPVNKVLTTDNVFDTISLVFGPEGGILKSEEEVLEKAGFEKVLLSDKILRTETVIIYLTSIIEYLKS